MTVPAMSWLALIGLLAGGLINYIAGLLLRVEDLFSQDIPYKDCQHRQSFWEMLPVFSFFCPTNACKHCRLRLFWEYPFVEIFTACSYLVLAWHFHLTLYSVGMMFFVSVLIAVCITDFKAKIIPHELTYPTIILGIIFSAQVRSDLVGALAGIGISYILFDFLAFYGLYVYLWLNKPTTAPSQLLLSSGEESSRLPQTVNQPFWFSKSSTHKHTSAGKKNVSYTSGLFCKGMPLEELEIIGGGDAVLAALISAWLGYRKLIIAVLVSILVGSILGALYLLIELWKQRLMHILIVPVTISLVSINSLAIIILMLMAHFIRQPLTSMFFLSVLPWTMFIGSLIGTMIAGSKFSKPFPFGPALAVGAMVALFT